MASLYKRKYKKSDRVTGKTTSQQTSKWYGKYTDADGVRRRVPLSSNKVVANQMLAELVRQNELGKVGLHDPFAEHRKRSVKDHVADFRQHLDSKGNSPDHVSLTVSRIQAAFTACDFRLLNDLDADKVANWLKSRRDDADEANRFGITTSNHHLVAVKSFGNWLVKARRLERNPFTHMSRLNAKIDVRVKRRALDLKELTRLIAAAEKSKRTFRGLSGQDRGTLYLLASMTGLRANELATLQLSAFNFKSEPPTVHVAAENEKAGRGAELPLHPFVVSRLSTWLQERIQLPPVTANSKTSQLLWPGTWSEKAAEMFRRDLAEARAAWLEEVAADGDELERRTKSEFLKAETSNGEIADFHGLRHSFITLLASSGVHPKVAQQLARHSSITLTMDRYSHVHLADLNAAVGNLPSLDATSAIVVPVTGFFGGTGLEVDSTDPAAGPNLAPAGDKTGFPLVTVEETTTAIPAVSETQKPRRERGLRIADDPCERVTEMSALGLEPRTYGLKVRCSTN